MFQEMSDDAFRSLFNTLDSETAIHLVQRLCQSLHHFRTLLAVSQVCIHNDDSLVDQC